MEKVVLDRRLEQMAEEGVLFETRGARWTQRARRDLRKAFDAILLAGARRLPGTCQFQAASSRAFISPWNFCPAEQTQCGR